MAKARIIIKDGIKSKRLEPDEIPLMDPESDSVIKARIEAAIDAILDKTDYVRMKGNPPTIGVEKETV